MEFKNFKNIFKIQKKNGYINFLELEIFKRFFFEKNHDPNKSVIVMGAGRSGTTWIAEVLSKFLDYRFIYEPFHPNSLQHIKSFKFKYFYNETDPNRKFYAIMNWILAGHIRNKWVDNNNRVFKPDGRIVKSIRLNFSIEWILKYFPKVPIIFIIRHPCAVVSSKKALGWSGQELFSLMKNEKIMNLLKEIDLYNLNALDSSLVRNTYLWGIENYFPLNIKNQSHFYLCYYEDLVNHFKIELRRIVNFINPTLNVKGKKIKNLISTQTNSKSAVVIGTDPLKIWKSRLTEEEINIVLKIVKKFSLDIIYNYHILPIKKL